MPVMRRDHLGGHAVEAGDRLGEFLRVGAGRHGGGTDDVAEQHGHRPHFRASGGRLARRHRTGLLPQAAFAAEARGGGEHGAAGRHRSGAPDGRIADFVLRAGQCDGASSPLRRPTPQDAHAAGSSLLRDRRDSVAAPCRPPCAPQYRMGCRQGAMALRDTARQIECLAWVIAASPAPGLTMQAAQQPGSPALCRTNPEDRHSCRHPIRSRHRAFPAPKSRRCPPAALARTWSQPAAAGADARTGIAGAESARPARDAAAASPSAADPAAHLPAGGQAATHPALPSALTSRRPRHLAGDIGSNRKDSFMAGSSGDAPQGGNRNNNPGNFANNREKASRAGQIGGSRQGAASNPGNFANNRDRAREAGHLGGVHQGKGNNPANFANDPAKAREAGHIGGTHQGRQNNPANFANDRSKASEAGRLGGQQRGAPCAGSAGAARPASIRPARPDTAALAMRAVPASLPPDGGNEWTAQGPARHPGIRWHRAGPVLRHAAVRPWRRRRCASTARAGRPAPRTSPPAAAAPWRWT